MDEAQKGLKESNQRRTNSRNQAYAQTMRQLDIDEKNDSGKEVVDKINDSEDDIADEFGTYEVSSYLSKNTK